MPARQKERPGDQTLGSLLIGVRYKYLFISGLPPPFGWALHIAKLRTGSKTPCIEQHADSPGPHTMNQLTQVRYTAVDCRQAACVAWH